MGFTIHICRIDTDLKKTHGKFCTKYVGLYWTVICMHIYYFEYIIMYAISVVPWISSVVAAIASFGPGTTNWQGTERLWGKAVIHTTFLTGSLRHACWECLVLWSRHYYFNLIYVGTYICITFFFCSRQIFRPVSNLEMIFKFFKVKHLVRWKKAGQISRKDRLAGNYWKKQRNCQILLCFPLLRLLFL